MNSQFRRHIASAALIIGFFVAWEVLCLGFGVRDIVLPRPSQIIYTLFARLPAIWPHAMQTLYTTLVGFGLGIVFGVLIGALIGSSRLAYDVGYPLLIGFSSIPKVAVVPIFVLWFGAGTVPAVLTAMILSIFPIIVNVAAGLATTEPELADDPKSEVSEAVVTILDALGSARGARGIDDVDEVVRTHLDVGRVDGVRGDALVEQRLGEGWLVALVVAPAPIANEVNQKVAVEALPVHAR